MHQTELNKYKKLLGFLSVLRITIYLWGTLSAHCILALNRCKSKTCNYKKQINSLAISSFSIYLIVKCLTNLVQGLSHLENGPRRVVCASKGLCTDCGSCGFRCRTRSWTQTTSLSPLARFLLTCRPVWHCSPSSLTVSLAVIQLSGLVKPSLFLTTQSKKCCA